MTSHEELDIFTASRITSYVYWGAGDMDTIVANVYHKGGIHVLDEVYLEDKISIENNGRYASIDLGLNNLATVSSNVVKTFYYQWQTFKIN